MSEKNILTIDNINPRLLKKSFAVRGPLDLRACEIWSLLKSNNEKSGSENPPKFKFNETIIATLGDGHALGMKPITFIRQIMALCTYPGLLDDHFIKWCKIFPPDVIRRVETLLDEFPGGCIGSYSPSPGYELVRKNIARFIDRRDNLNDSNVIDCSTYGITTNGCSSVNQSYNGKKSSGKFPECDWKTVFVSSGATDAIKNFLALFIQASNDDQRPNEFFKSGIMTPIPQYPIYSIIIAEYDMLELNYYLNEKTGWGINIPELQELYQRALEQNCQPRVLIIINPGNPTGQILSLDDMIKILRFVHEHKLFLLCDEVYQHNDYYDTDDVGWRSFRRVLYEETPDISDEVEMASLYSISKGYAGECGIRGGYIQFTNVSADILDVFLQMALSHLCPTTLGQVALDCVVNPPIPGEPSFVTYAQEKDSILNALNLKAKLINSRLAKGVVEGIEMNPIQGAMYAFPKIFLPYKFILHAKKINKKADFLFAEMLLEEKGLALLPGSGFGCNKHGDTWREKSYPFHFRITILPEISKLERHGLARTF
ncbi:unnamed protein product [Gordionus sp. m RMFG-2023]